MERSTERSSETIQQGFIIQSQKTITLNYIKAFVRDLGEHLESLLPSELFVLFQAQGINRGDKEKFSRTFDALVDAVQSVWLIKSNCSWADNNDVESIDELELRS